MKSLISLLFIFSIFTLVYAQPGADTIKKGSTLETKVSTSGTIQSSSSSGFISANSFTKLTATNEGVKAEANIAYSIKTWNLSLNASTPISGTGQQVKPVTLDGLSNNTRLTFGAQTIMWGKGFKWKENKSFAQARKAIGKDKDDDFSTNDLTEDEKLRFYQVASAGIDWGRSILFGGSFSVEKQSFNYVANKTTLEGAQTSKYAVHIKGTVGVLYDGGIFAASFTHANGYQASSPVKYYVPINSSGVLIEKNLSPDAPQHQNSEKLRVEFLSNGKAKFKNDQVVESPIRINPNINIEFSQQLFAFEFPVYFLKNNTNFNGGIYAGYVSDRNFTFNTDKDNFGFGVFIGANFNTLFR